MNGDIALNLDHAGLGSITLNGQKLRGVQGVTINTQAGEPTRVELDLVMLDTSTLAEGARVLIPEATRDALIALGWTPPTETAP